MSNTRQFTQDELEDLGLPYENAIATEPHEEARWGTRTWVTFEHGGKHWRVEFYAPATEMQEGQDLWDTDPVEAVEVHQVEVTTSVWRPVP